MTSRQHRMPSKTAPPDPLIFRPLHDRTDTHGYLQTPPATGLKTGTRKFFNPKHECSAQTHYNVPPTPISPHAAEIHRIEQEEVATADLSDSTETQHIPSSPSPSKRVREEPVDATSSRPMKHRILESALISDPSARLHTEGVPFAYMRQQLHRVAGQLYNRTQGASCLIKCVPRTRESGIRVKVTPCRSPETTFYMQLKDESSTERQQRGSRTAIVGSNSSAATKKRDESSASIPLHLEVALARAPVLASLLLSGRVFRGDSIEIELPHPELFAAVMRWMYTGQIHKAVCTEKFEQCMRVLQGSQIVV